MRIITLFLAVQYLGILNMFVFICHKTHRKFYNNVYLDLQVTNREQWNYPALKNCHLLLVYLLVHIFLTEWKNNDLGKIEYY